MTFKLCSDEMDEYVFCDYSECDRMVVLCDDKDEPTKLCIKRVFWNHGLIID
jgi:hypothetical protein